MTTNTKLLHYKKHDQRERERDPHSPNVHSFVTRNTVTATYAAKLSPEHLLYVEKVHLQVLRSWILQRAAKSHVISLPWHEKILFIRFKRRRGRIQIQQRERNKYKIYFLNCTKYTCMVISLIVKMLYALLPYFFNTKGFNAKQGFTFFIAWIFFFLCFHLTRDERNLYSKIFFAYFLPLNCSSSVERICL